MKTSKNTSGSSAIYRLAMAACFLTGCFFTLRAFTPPRITVMSEANASTSNENTLIPSAVLNHPTAAATPELVTQNIEDIRLGQRVVGTNPLREQTQAASEIDPGTWRAVRLSMVQGGVEYDLAFLRPVSWLEATGAKVGGSIHMELHEMGLDGQAKVIGIDACPQIETDDGTGRNVVTGTMAHAGANILYLDITGLDEPLGVTDTHPIWSETRQDFVVAGQLEVGEQFRTLTGESATLTKIHPHRGPPEMVFNLEVDAEHVYAVAGNGLLVHNSCLTEDLVTSAMRPSRPGSRISRGVQSLQKRIDNGSNFFGASKTDEAASGLIREIMGDLQTATTRPNGVDLRDTMGRGVRITDGLFDTFLHPGGLGI